MGRYDLPEDPRIVESWYTGDDPDHVFDPWDDEGGIFDETRGGAGDRFCHQVLGFVLGLDQGTIDDHEAELVDVWCGLRPEVQKWYMKEFRDICPQETRLLYNKWYYETYGGQDNGDE